MISDAFAWLDRATGIDYAVAALIALCGLIYIAALIAESRKLAASREYDASVPARGRGRGKSFDDDHSGRERLPHVSRTRRSE